jgi:outer membrane protein OmpA-like peptidoglycan-associated protein
MKENEFNVVSGEFEGNFYTNQKNILTDSDFLSLKSDHSIHLYRGELFSVKKESDDFKPESFRNRESFLLNNVSNIQFNLGKENEENRIYDFEQLLIKNARIVHSWEFNDKTYGIVKGDLYGKVKQRIFKAQQDNPPPPPKPIDPIRPPVPPVEKKDPIIEGGGDRIINPPERKGCVPGCATGCLGCFSNLWFLLLGLGFLLLLLWFLNLYWDYNYLERYCCNERDNLEIENDRLRFENEELLRKLNECIQNDSITIIQDEIDQLSSQIYFYGDRTLIRKISEGQIEKIANILKKYPDLKVSVNGYKNTGSSEESIDGLDFKRALSIKNMFVNQYGIEEERIDARGMGQSMVDPTDYYETEYDYDGTYFQWNRNMRVDIKIIK